MTPLSITESIVEQLRIYIIVGALKPGQKLNEVQLSSRLGISRPPLREAFRLLENERLVISVSRKGSYVTEISWEDCQEVFQVREMIECAAVDLFKAKGIKTLPKVAAALEKTVDLLVPKNTDPQIRFQYLKTVADFHIKLVESAGNSRLVDFFNSIFISMARYQAMYMYQPGFINEAQKVHENILLFIEKGNYSQAKSLLSSHILGFLKTMKEKMREKRS